MTLEKLKQYTGNNGQKAYIDYKGHLPVVMVKSLENNPIPIGIFYQTENITFEKHMRGAEKNVLFNLTHNLQKIQTLFRRY